MIIIRNLLPTIRQTVRSILGVAVLWWAGMTLAVGQPTTSKPRPWLPELMDGLPNVRDVAVSPDGKECYFTIQSLRKEFAAILVMQKEGDSWGRPAVAPFSGRFIDIEPAFSPDGERLYFASTRPADPDSSTAKNYDLWYVERAKPGETWSDPARLPPPVNTLKDEFYPSVSSTGNIYFTRESADPKRKEDIFVSRREGSGFGEPQPLSDAVNSERYEFNAFVAPDETFILFTSYGRPDDLGGGDLYVSTRSGDGEWIPARHLGKGINSNRIDYCPFVDVRNGLLYFTSERSEIPVKYDRKQNLESLLERFNGFERGAGRVYVAPFRIDDLTTAPRQ